MFDLFVFKNVGIIQVFTSQCCCEVKLDRTIGLSFNLQVRQVAGTPWDSSYLHRKSPRLHSLESDQGPLTPGQRLLEPCPAANSVPSRNSEFLPSPPPPAPRGAPQQPRKNGNLGASAPTVGAARSAQISSDHRVQARPQPNSGPTPRDPGEVVRDPDAQGLGRGKRPPHLKPEHTVRVARSPEAQQST